MFEISVTVKAPELEGAINSLALAIRDRGAAQMVIPAGTSAQAAGVSVPTASPIPAPVAVSEPMAAPQAAAPVVPLAPVPAAPVAPAPAVPVAPPVQAAPQGGATPASGVTLDAIITAGASLVEKGLMNQVVAILTRYGVQAVNQLQPAQFEPFAAELRALGARI